MKPILYSVAIIVCLLMKAALFTLMTAVDESLLKIAMFDLFFTFGLPLLIVSILDEKPTTESEK